MEMILNSRLREEWSTSPGDDPDPDRPDADINRFACG